MHRFLKRSLLLLSCALLASSSLTGCVIDELFYTATSSPDSSTTESTEITFWNIGTESPALELWQYAVDQYNQNNAEESGYYINATSTVNDQYKQKLLVAMSADECPDMYIHWSGGQMYEYIDAGFAQPIGDLMGDDISYFADGAIAQSTYQDEIYAVPVMANSIAGIFYNTEIYAELGLEEPSTLTELEENCDAMVEAGYIPFALANATQWTGSIYYMFLVVRYAGTTPFAEAVEGSGSFSDECFIYAGQKIQQWVTAGYFPTTVNELDDDSGQARLMMYNEEAVMQLSGAWTVGTYSTDNPEFYEKVGYFSFPAIEDGYEDSSIIVGTMGDNFISFNCTDEKLLEAYTCAQYYMDETYCDMLISYGKLPPYAQTFEYDDPVVEEIAAEIENASEVQLWYDQYLPSAMAEVHKTETQKLFDLSSSAVSVAAAQEEAMEAYLAEIAEN